MKLSFSPIILILLIILLGIQKVNAQIPPPEPPYIEVNGLAEKEIVPDKIFLGILIQERTSGKDQITVAQQEEKLRNGLKKNGIELENLYVSDANYQNRHWRGKEVVSQMQYELKLANATQVSNVFALLDEIEITNAWINRVDHSQINDYKKELRIEAIKAAKAKSDYLLNAIGQQTSRALIVRENEYYNPMPMYNYKAAGMMAMEDSGGMPASEPLDFKKMKIQASIYVKFEVK
jgi:uncharacterized protein